MTFAFLCHNPADACEARELAGWLERNSSCEVRLAECGAGCADDLIEAAEQALSAAAVILLLSPDSVPEKWVRSRWEPVLLQQPAESGTALACMLLRECRFPELLRRRNFFDAGLAGRRALKVWLLARFPRVVALPPVGAAAPADEIESLRGRVADEPGDAAGVPHEAALAFTDKCQEDFEGVVWISGARRTAAGICGDLAETLGLRLSGPAAENADRLREFCAARRLLLVFDACEPPFAREGKCSIVRTAPHPADPPASIDVLGPLFTSWTRNPSECLEKLGDVPEAVGAAGWQAARSLGYSAVALLRHRERAAELLEMVELLLPLAAAAGDESAVRHLEWERSWILQAWGQAGTVDLPVLPPAPGDQLALPFPL